MFQELRCPPCDITDWTRFQYYAQMIRVLSFSGKELSGEFLLAVAVYRPFAGPLLPRVKELSLPNWSDCLSTKTAYIHLFTGPALLSCAASGWGSLCDVSNLLKSLSSSSPYLEDLVLPAMSGQALDAVVSKFRATFTTEYELYLILGAICAINLIFTPQTPLL